METNSSFLLKNNTTFSLDIIDEICQRYSVHSLRIFGSVARGTEKESSDIDILVDFEKPVSLLDLVRLQRELSKTFGKQVDLVTEKALSPYIRSQVISQAQVLYERT